MLFFSRNTDTGETQFDQKGGINLPVEVVLVTNRLQKHEGISRAKPPVQEFTGERRVLAVAGCHRFGLNLAS